MVCTCTGVLSVPELCNDCFVSFDDMERTNGCHQQWEPNCCGFEVFAAKSSLRCMIMSRTSWIYVYEISCLNSLLTTASNTDIHENTYRIHLHICASVFSVLARLMHAIQQDDSTEVKTVKVYRKYISFCIVSSLASVGSVALLVARRTNGRKVAGSRPTKVSSVYHSVDR